MLKPLFLVLALCCVLSGIEAQQQSQTPSKTSYFKGGKLYIVCSSHQDIAWMDSIEACIKFRDEQMITPALKRMEESATYCFSVEDALSLREYLERHPDRYDEILKRTLEGRLEWGATNKQPYPSMYDGEALVRQTYFGRKYLEKTLPGGDYRTAYNEDVPGVALQLPQILAKAGIPYYQISRHQPGFYRWQSPDGSYITCWSPGQYHENTMPVSNAKTDEARTDVFIRYLNEFDDYYKQRKIPPVRFMLYSFDFSKPINWDAYMDAWNAEVKGKNPRKLPYIYYSTANRVMDEVTANKKTKFDVLQGERPDVWLYIHGPGHQRALKAAREASRLLTAAEKFCTFSALLDGSFDNYPQKELYSAWENAIYADHGWGGRHGALTDRVFRTKFEYGRDVAREELDKAMTSISQKISYKKDSTVYRAVTVFNPLSWERTDPVVFTLDVEGWNNTHIRLKETTGADVPFQLTDVPDLGKRDEALAITFIAEKVPPLGYKTYYITYNPKDNNTATHGFTPSEAVSNTATATAESKRHIETPLYKLTLGAGGIESLYDKELQKEFFKTDKFSGGELFVMQSVGNGAGEFTDVQQPTMQGFDQLRNYNLTWQCIETGAVRDVYQTIQPLRETQAVVRIVVYKTIKRIDVETDLNRFSGENWREFRLAFPLNLQQSKVAYEVPMGVVEVGKDEIAGAAGFSKATQIYSTPCKDVHPREVQDWFSATDGETGLTISSDVAVFDYIDPTDKKVDYTILQPLLLASRKSCHGAGNYYLQPGNHHYRFSLYTHSGDWRNGYRLGTQSRQPLQSLVGNPQASKGSTLPDEHSFATLTGGKGVIISTIKKCEDDNSVILRCYEIEGADAEVSFSIEKAGTALFKTDMIEENPVKITTPTVKIGHHAIETFKIQ